jgi:hypothetical protein
MRSQSDRMAARSHQFPCLSAAPRYFDTKGYRGTEAYGHNLTVWLQGHVNFLAFQRQDRSKSFSAIPVSSSLFGVIAVTRAAGTEVYETELALQSTGGVVPSIDESDSSSRGFAAVD